MFLDLRAMKLRTRIRWGYSIPLSLTLVATIMVINNAQKVRQQTQAVDDGWQRVRSIDRLELLVYQRMAYIRSYLLTGNEVFAQRYETSVEEYQNLIAQVESNIAPSSQQAAYLEIVKKLGEEIYTYNHQLIALTRSGKLDASTKQLTQSNLLQLSDQLSGTFKDLNSLESRLQSEQQNQGKEAINLLIIISILGSLVAIALAALIGFWIAGRITNQVNNTANTIAGTSTEIAATVEQQEKMIVQQATSVNQTSTTMDELKNSVQQASQQAVMSADGAKAALKQASDGNESVSRTVKGMMVLETKVKGISEQMLHLAEQTNQIASIVDLVTNLANQTNMLALNAAVEAVRVGEHGKGFGVVATEIRKLADQSKQSDEKINGLVTEIQRGMHATVLATEEGFETVREGVQIAQETARAFNEMAETINAIFVNSQNIALNSQQQELAVQQVAESMNLLNLAAKEVAHAITQTKAGTRQLNQVALELQKTM